MKLRIFSKSLKRKRSKSENAFSSKAKISVIRSKIIRRAEKRQQDVALKRLKTLKAKHENENRAIIENHYNEKIGRPLRINRIFRPLSGEYFAIRLFDQ